VKGLGEPFADYSSSFENFASEDFRNLTTQDIKDLEIPPNIAVPLLKEIESLKPAESGTYPILSYPN
jgi:hypothetical protein